MNKITSDYSIFKKREDNREDGINRGHVHSLMRSIEKKNNMEKNPIIVNEDMEIISGQHRLEACKNLGLPVPYIIDKTASPEDMLIYGICRRWTLSDILNFYVRNGNQNYIKLRDFIKESGLKMSVCISLVVGHKKKESDIFKLGEYVFECPFEMKDISFAKDIVALIRAVNTYTAYLDTSKFWMALMALVSHADYNHARCMRNLQSQIYKVGPKARKSDYKKMFCNLYNFKHSSKIYLDELADDQGGDNE